MILLAVERPRMKPRKDSSGQRLDLAVPGASLLLDITMRGKNCFSVFALFFCLQLL